MFSHGNSLCPVCNLKIVSSREVKEQELYMKQKLLLRAISYPLNRCLKVANVVAAPECFFVGIEGAKCVSEGTKM